MRVLGVALLLAGLPLGVLAGETGPTVYTNADLEKFGQPSSTPGTPIKADDTGWQAVQSFLDRQFARIEADRQHELERREADRLEAEAAAVLYQQDSLWMPYGGYWPGYAGWGSAPIYGPGMRSDSRHHGPRRGQPPLYPGVGRRSGIAEHRAFLSYRPTLPALPPRGGHPSHGNGHAHR